MQVNAATNVLVINNFILLAPKTHIGSVKFMQDAFSEHIAL